MRPPQAAAVKKLGQALVVSVAEKLGRLAQQVWVKRDERKRPAFLLLSKRASLNNFIESTAHFSSPRGRGRRRERH
jgi:hypothetical protein